jgi:sulfopyruvate decarboxylase TPP-binding subunit
VSNLVDGGIAIFSGEPRSYITPLINEVIESPQANYVNAVNEGDAVALVAGAWLGGRLGVRLRHFWIRSCLHKSFRSSSMATLSR